MSDTAPRFTPVRDFRVAVSFLTRIPTGWIESMHAGDLTRAAWAFPVVGLLVGGISGGVLYLAAGQSLHTLLCALIALSLQALITGALHEDGLADVADGFGALAQSRILEIMRDSRIGSYGVLALVFSIAIRSAALASVPGPGMAWATMLAAAAASRGVLPLVMTMIAPARTDGLSHGAGRPSKRTSCIALGIGFIALFVCLPLQAAFAAILIGAPLITLVLLWAVRRLGGQTGDVLGALQQMTEIAVLIGAAGWSLSYP